MQLGRRAFIGAAAGTALLSTESATGRLTAAQASESWQSPGYDSRNTGHAVANTGPVSDGQGAWSLTAETGYISVQHPPLVDGGMMYVSLTFNTDEGAANYLCAVSLRDGSIQWRAEGQPPTEAIFRTCYIGESGVYSLRTTTQGTSDGPEYELVRHSQADGTRQWTAQLPGEVHPEEVGQTVVADGTVFLLTGLYDGEPTLVAVGADNGSTQWTQSVDRSDRFDGVSAGGLAVADGTVYLTAYGYEERINEAESTGTLDGFLLVSAHSPADGTTQWETSEPVVTYRGELFEGQLLKPGPLVNKNVLPPTVADGTVYTGANMAERDDTTDQERVNRGQLVGVETGTGTVAWTKTFSDRIDGPPAVTDDRLYVVIDTELHAISLTDRQSVWTTSVPVFINGQPTVASETVYVESIINGVYAFSVTDGTERWQQSVQEQSYAAPAQLSRYGGPPVVDSGVVRLNGRDRLQLLTENGNSPVSSGQSQSGTPSQTENGTPGGTETTGDSEEKASSSGSGPGFGIMSSIAGAGAVGYLLAEHLSSESKQ